MARPKSRATARSRSALQPSAGRIYDVDFIESLNATQVLLRVVGPSETLSQAYLTNDQLMELVACAGLVPKMTAMIIGKGPAPQTIFAIYLKSKARRVTRGAIKELSFAEGTATVIIEGQPTELSTDDPRMVAILTSAMQLQQPVQEVAYDETTHRLNRAKINVA